MAYFHCRIEEQDGKFILTDLKSRNGTFLNGDKIISSELKTGDHVKVGFSVMEFHDDEQRPVDAPAREVLATEARPQDKPQPLIKKCYLCGKILDDMDFIGGRAKEINGRPYCPACVGIAQESESPLLSESPSGGAPPPQPVPSLQPVPPPVSSPPPQPSPPPVQPPVPVMPPVPSPPPVQPQPPAPPAPPQPVQDDKPAEPPEAGKKKLVDFLDDADDDDLLPSI
jgi:hypothetical protein